MKRRVAILISGRGSNMAALIRAAAAQDFPAEIAVVISNRADAQGLDKAQASGVPTLVIESKPFGKERAAFETALQAALDRHGVELILHGHDHIHSTMWFEGPNGNIPAIGVPSASALAHGHYPAAAYNLFRIEKDNAGWRCEQTVRGLGAGFQIQQIRHARLI